MDIHGDEGSHLLETHPRLSVILCTYNRRELVLSVLASLRSQSLAYDQFEVIVVDNGSGDGTRDAVRRYVRTGAYKGCGPEDIWRVLCLSEPRNGLAYARNTGLLAASGEIAVFLDDDTLADPCFLECLLSAYEETGADAVGARVDLRWEGTRPHWLSDDLLGMLGYFAPVTLRARLGAATGFSSCSFSVKIEALHAIGYFSPFLGKRSLMPVNADVRGLCLHLAQAGYTLWYEPAAVVVHLVHASRLNLAFFVGRAYWQGRSEALLHYARALEDEEVWSRFTASLLKAAFAGVRGTLLLLLIHRPLLYLSGRSTNERLLAAMEQARRWGYTRQWLYFLAQGPSELPNPPVLLVSSSDDVPAELLARALKQRDVSCVAANMDLPLLWLWQHRALAGQARAIVHFYRVGAFELSPRRRQRLLFRLWLARRWGIPVVTSDPGGCWQCARGPRFLTRRLLELSVMHQSASVLTSTRRPDLLYGARDIRCRVSCLPHPGFRGYYASPLPRAYACEQLGLAGSPSFIYLCFAGAHTGREVLYLLEAFQRFWQSHAYPAGQLRDLPQLLLAGLPGDGRESERIARQAALHPAIHLSRSLPTRERIPLYLGAVDAVVLPHLAMRSAGLPEMALLALSYERVVVVPDLPRYSDLPFIAGDVGTELAGAGRPNTALPSQGVALYDPGSQESLVQALRTAQSLEYRLSETAACALEVENGWGRYAYRLLEIYWRLLSNAAASPRTFD